MKISSAALTGARRCPRVMKTDVAVVLKARIPWLGVTQGH
jgi:hypothetical protein